MTSGSCTPARRAVALSALLLTIGFGQETTRAQDFAKTSRSVVASDIRDAAGLFDPAAVAKAKATLAMIDRQDGVATVIETVESLGDEPILDAAKRRAPTVGPPALYILIEKKKHKLEILPARGLQNRIDRQHELAIRDAFIASFKEGKFDEGLSKGIHAIASAVEVPNEKGKLRISDTNSDTLRAATRFAGEGNASSSLVVRNQVRLTLAGARKIISAAEAKAAEMGLKMNIAVVDDGGHLPAFARMDGARPASGYTALTKATTAATFRQETGPLPKGTTTPDPLLNLSLQNAAAASGGKVTTLLGGVPVVVDGQIIGGVGVGGGSGEQDAVVAKAGIAAFTAEVETPAANPAKIDEKAKKADQ